MNPYVDMIVQDVRAKLEGHDSVVLSACETRTSAPGHTYEHVLDLIEVNRLCDMHDVYEWLLDWQAYGMTTCSVDPRSGRDS